MTETKSEAKPGQEIRAMHEGNKFFKLKWVIKSMKLKTSLYTTSILVVTNANQGKHCNWKRDINNNSGLYLD